MQTTTDPVILKEREEWRTISEIQKKIKNSYYFKPMDVMLSCSLVGQILDQSADLYGDKTAVISVHQNISKKYSELRYEADKLASGLVSIGLKRGDRLGIFSPNCYEWLLTQYATAKVGVIMVNINPAYQARELEFCLKKVGCKALVTWDIFKTQDYYKLLCEIIPELPKSIPGRLKNSKLPNLEIVIMISDSKKDGILNFKDVLDSGNKESDKILSETKQLLQFDDPIIIQFTSGTTGTPKAAVLTHHNIVNNALITGQTFGHNLLTPVLCCHVPLFHCYGCVIGSLSTIFYHGTCVLPGLGFDAISSMKAIEKYKCTAVFGTPTMFVDMMNKYKSGEYNIGSLRQVVMGGAAATSSLVEDMQKLLNVSSFQVGYGATETSALVSASGLIDEFENIAEGIMHLTALTEVKVINEEGQLLPVNTQGELCIRGHNIFLGYWGDEEKTAEVLDKTRWYHTGDLSIMNEYGCIRIVGRIKDIIIRGGENIYPVEVENFISTHPAVLDVHICGVPDKRMGEEACAWIHLKEDMKLSEAEIKGFCKGKISHFKIPRYIMFVQEFPKTLTGKVKKFEMTRISTEKLKL